MAAFVDFVEVDEAGVASAGPGLRSAVDVFGEDGDGDGDLYLCGSFGCRAEDASAFVLPVEAGGRGAAPGEPVQREVVEDVVLCRQLLRVVAVGQGREAGA
ncbi:hypothetical protein ACQ86N_27840 [Puia sp. P3]|uniref:hypothetical protein n=1 Tax=Puia sp. P3 TaxID=3423952 RepID=UPI003D6724F9